MPIHTTTTPVATFAVDGDAARDGTCYNSGTLEITAEGRTYAFTFSNTLGIRPDGERDYFCEKGWGRWQAMAVDAHTTPRGLLARYLLNVNAVGSLPLDLPDPFSLEAA